MWEYSISINNSNKKVLDFIFDTSKKYLSNIGGIVTLYKNLDSSMIIYAVEEDKKEKVQTFISKCITRTIGLFFKNNFLDEHLYLPISDDISKVAFKKALINFDKETDFYIISRALSFDKELYLESFYNFKLPKLREKWEELISLANENKDYLLNSEVFYDLLKFLVDNIDISESEIDIVEDEDGYRIFSGNEENSLYGLNSEGLISSVIDMSPQKINLYLKKENDATNILKRIYEHRVNFKFPENNKKECLFFSKI